MWRRISVSGLFSAARKSRIAVAFLASLSCSALRADDDDGVGADAFHSTGSQVVIDRETFEQFSARLEATEAELRSLRKLDAAPVAFGGSAAQSSDGHDMVPCADYACEAETATRLVPVSLDCGLGAITFSPGMRIQTRYSYDALSTNNDIFVRRTRLKGGGDAFGIAKYYSEIKFDGTGAVEVEAIGVIENAWLDFPLFDGSTFLRVGLYDVPFSRNALTSDSKLLFMDRSLIKSLLTTSGLTDNTIGALLHDRPANGRLEYAIGVFDNVIFERIEQMGPEDSTDLMLAGRVAVNLLDPDTVEDGYGDYRESYVGEGRRLQFGGNLAYLPEAVDGMDMFELYAFGVDMFFNGGPWVFQAEYNWFKEDLTGGQIDLTGEGWYVQAGYFLGCACGGDFELAARYQQLKPEDAFDMGEDDKLAWTSFGVNYYMRDHNLKLQMDYTVKREEQLELDNDLFQTQLQFDF